MLYPKKCNNLKKVIITKFKNIEVLDSLDFQNISNNKLLSSRRLKSLKEGNVFLIKNVLNDLSIKQILNYFNSNKSKEDFSYTKNPKVIQNTKNLWYESKKENSSNVHKNRYTACDRSFYIFPWNEDKSPISCNLTKFYDQVLSFQGLNPKEIKSLTPKDGSVQRIHLIHYPLHTGHISLHTDPDEVCNVICGIYLTEHGKDYEGGGFYVLNEENSEVLLDKNFSAGDAILFYPCLPHGVKEIKPVFENKISNGRYFLNMMIIQSHEVKNRSYAKALL